MKKSSRGSATFEDFRGAALALSDVEEGTAYYTTDHHRPYPWVLARMSKVHASVVQDLVQMGWRSVQKKPTKRRKRAR